jgi:hypothetical protein
MSKDEEGYVEVKEEEETDIQLSKEDWGKLK